MINLHFQVKPYFLAYYALTGTCSDHFRHGRTDPLVLAYQERARALNKDALALVENDNTDTYFMEKAINSSALSSAAANLDDLLSKLQLESSFQSMLAQTNQALVRIRHDWENSLPKMQSYACHLYDGAKPLDINVYVTQPSMSMSGTFCGDIYMTDFSEQENGNPLYLWSSLTEAILDGLNAAGAKDSDHIWISRLITQLCREEVQKRFKSTAARNDDSDDRAFCRDLDWLRPQFQEFIKQPDYRTIAQFHEQAYKFMMEKWLQKKKTKK
jgi:hypothetical protein